MPESSADLYLKSPMTIFCMHLERACMQNIWIMRWKRE